MTGHPSNHRLLIPCLLLLFFSAPSFAADAPGLTQAVDGYILSLTPMQRVSMLFLVNIDGDTAYRALELDDDGTPLVPGGCLFFSYNVAPAASGLIEFTRSIAGYCKRHKLPRPYTAIDQEGGAVNRLRELNSPLPSPALVAGSLTAGEAARLYAVQGAQMAALGFDLNLAPVAEALAGFNGDYLGRRAYGGAGEAAAYSYAAVRAYQEEGVLCAVKHFPGNSNSDPHTGSSVLSIDGKELALSVQLPFAFVLSSSPAAVLMSHAVVPSVDARNPAVLSERWIKGELRGRLGYEGLVISDDIFMGAVSSFGMGNLAVKAISSGADVLMLSDKYFKSVASALCDAAARDPDFAARLHEAERHVVQFKLRAGILRAGESGDGSLLLEEVPLDEQRGPPSARLKAFEEAKGQGEEFYRRHFSGGAR
ncbi:MAG: glycoside hydrolase family 3 protein [Treponema sp.]|nr:glycoside hydrolase family 3 protein [Treponema sp.]